MKATAVRGTVGQAQRLASETDRKAVVPRDWEGEGGNGGYMVHTNT